MSESEKEEREIKEKKGKKVTLTPIGEGMILQNEDGTLTLVGLPTKTKKLIALEGGGGLTPMGIGGKVKGMEYMEKDYDWYVYSRSALTSGEVTTLRKEIQYTSGTIVSTITPLVEERPPSNSCIKCGTPIPSNAKYCLHCGAHLEQ